MEAQESAARHYEGCSETRLFLDYETWLFKIVECLRFIYIVPRSEDC